MENIEKNEAIKSEGCGCGCAQAEQEAVQKVESVEKEAPRRSYFPAVDIVDGGSESLLVVDLPGVQEGDLDISLEKNVLTVRAKQSVQHPEGKRLVYSEYGVGNYERSFSLSDEIDRESISASLKDGVLQIKLSKSAPVSKKINVSAS